MKKIKIFSLLLVVLLCIGMLAGCGATSENSYVDGDYGNLTGDSIMNEMSPMEPGDIEMGNSSTAGSGTSSGSGDNSPAVNAQKIIYTYRYDIESTDFDKSIEELEKAIKDSEGYIESSNISGNRYYYKNTRVAEYTIRIPTKSANKFVEYIDANCIISRKEIDTDDVTMTYVDIQSRISALNTRKAKLEEFMTQATNMSDLLTIQKELSNVIYEIESYEARLRTYDNLIDYTTIYLTIDEVETPTVVEEKTMWQEIKDKFGTNLDDVIEGCKNFVIFLVSSIPQFVVIFIIVFPTILIIKRISKKRRARKMAQAQSMAVQCMNGVPNNAVAPQYYQGRQGFAVPPMPPQTQAPVKQEAKEVKETNESPKGNDLESTDETKPE